MERDKALEMAMSQIEKQFGKGAIMRMGEHGHVGVEAIPTGALALDIALGIGGLPRGRIVEIFGPESSGKSTLAMHVVAEAQRNGGICAYIDAEHAMDPVYAQAIGVNVDDLLISQPDTGEQALEIADMLIRSGAIDVMVIDSVAALMPRAEIEGEMGDTHVGLQARLMSQALRKLTGTLNRSNTICIFINQLREKIGVMFGCLSYGTRVTLADGTQEKIGKIVNQRCRSRCCPTTPTSTRSSRRRSSTGSTTAAPRGSSSSPSRRAGNGRAQFALHAEPSDPHARRLAGGAGARGRRSGPAGRAAPPLRLPMGGRARRPDGRRRAVAQSQRSRRPVPVRPRAEADRVLRLEGVAVRQHRREPSTNAQGSRVLRHHAAARAGRAARAVYVDGKKVFSDDYLKQLTPLSLAIWYMDDGGFTLRAKGLQERTRGGSGRSEICVEAMEPTTGRGWSAYLARHLGHHAEAHHAGGKAVLQFPKAETAKLHALIAPFVHPSMEYKLLPRYRGRFAVEPVFTPMRHELDADADHGDPAEAADAEHAPLRHRGGGQPQLLRRRRDGAQLT